MNKPVKTYKRDAIKMALNRTSSHPIRVKEFLLPVWYTEVDIYEKLHKQYGLMDLYISKAIFTGGLDSPQLLSDFFHIPFEHVRETLKYLKAIEHIESTVSPLRLTSLGQESIESGTLYVREPQPNRVVICFMNEPLHPMPKRFYKNKDLFKSRSDISDYKNHEILGGHQAFRPDAIDKALALANREDYNISKNTDKAILIQAEQKWLPICVVQNLGSPEWLVYSRAQRFHDESLHAALSDFAIPMNIASETLNFWRDWFAEREQDVELEVLDKGVIRANLPNSAVLDPLFGLPKVGNMHVDWREGFFVQIWYRDEEIRKKALKQQCANLENKRSTIDWITRIRREIVQQLELSLSELDPLPPAGQPQCSGSSMTGSPPSGTDAVGIS